MITIFKKMLLEQNLLVQDAIKKSWGKISPVWPLKNLIAVNPLQGFEELPIEKALIEGVAYFQQADLPVPMYAVNRETIKWLQAFFDQAQATIYMPMQNHGLYVAWKNVARFDEKLYGKDIIKQKWITELPECPEQAVFELLTSLEIPVKDWEQFLILMLTTLPGWAAYIKYRTDWSGSDYSYSNKVSQADYLAIRLATAFLLWPESKLLLKWHQKAKEKALLKKSPMENIELFENKYQRFLLKNILPQSPAEQRTPLVQLVFCIDVRSEPFRRALESTGDYETYGFAGFFGIPVSIKDNVTHETYGSCPVLLLPQHKVCKTKHFSNKEELKKDYDRYIILKTFKQFYQSLKYNFTTPFALVETLGLYAGAWMALRTFFPITACDIKKSISSCIRPLPVMPPDYSTDDIKFTDQCTYAESALRMMGLTKDFSSMVVLCGHGSTTQNNAYATALDCGACAGRHGGANACILAKILNDIKVRKALFENGVIIPESTCFIGAEHNTTTDEVILYGLKDLQTLDKLKNDLKTAKELNSQWRCKEMDVEKNSDSVCHTLSRSNDWAQVRPEWGLAGNAAFIVGPRYLTKNSNLKGRAFLHSYDYTQDIQGASLRTILTAPMVVAQWINMQYLFSTLDNVAYGSGSKITHNITGKLGIMQGSASDLMNGLALQSVYSTDSQAYHQAQRLITLVYAPRNLIENVILTEKVLIKLFGNGWALLTCIDPETQQSYFLRRDLTWQKTD